MLDVRCRCMYGVVFLYYVWLYACGVHYVYAYRIHEK